MISSWIMHTLQASAAISSVMSGSHRLRLSITVPSRIWSFCGTKATTELNCDGSISRTGTPPTVTSPAVGLSTRAATPSSVDLPLPTEPTTPTKLPSGTVSDTPLSTGLPPP